MWVIGILWSFRLVLEGKTGKGEPESSRLEKFSGSNFALLDAEDNTSGPLNRGGIADLPLLRTLITIRQKSWGKGFWEVRPKKKLVSGNAGDEKNPHPGSYKFIFLNQFSGDILFSSLVSFAFFVFRYFW